MLKPFIDHRLEAWLMTPDEYWSTCWSLNKDPTASSKTTNSGFQRHDPRHNIDIRKCKDDQDTIWQQAFFFQSNEDNSVTIVTLPDADDDPSLLQISTASQALQQCRPRRYKSGTHLVSATPDPKGDGDGSSSQAPCAVPVWASILVKF